MSRNVRRKITSRENEKVDQDNPGIEEFLVLDVRGGVVDWTKLPDDNVIQLFSRLNYRDRANLASTCRAWKRVGESESLWQELDLRSHKFDTRAAASLAQRCQRNLQKLRFRGAESADAIINLQSRNLCEISGDCCNEISDSTLRVIAALNEKLESLTLDADLCERITSNGIKAVAICCPRLRKLCLSGIRKVDGEAINALARHCPNLVDIGFIDCDGVDGIALGNVLSVRYLSVSGTFNINWATSIPYWSNLPNLIGLDVSMTDITSTVVSTLFSSLQNLKVLCAFSCPWYEDDVSFVSNNNHKGKSLLAPFTDVLEGVASLFAADSNTQQKQQERRNVFMDWRNSNVFMDKKLDEFMNWVERILSHSLLRVVESGQQGLDYFWLNQGVFLLLSLMQSSSQVEVQERATAGLAAFAFIGDTGEDNRSIDGGRTETVLRDGGIRLLLNLAKSWHEGLQSEAAKAIANLSLNNNFAKAVAEEGGINVLTNLARSMDKLVAKYASGGLLNISDTEEHKVAIAQAGGVKALVDLISICPTSCDKVLMRAAAGLGNFALDGKCSMEVVAVGGVHALVTLVRTSKDEEVQEAAARALANLASHGKSHFNNAAVGQEVGALEALVQLMQSAHDGVRDAATGALWNLCPNERNRKAIAAIDGGPDALERLLTLAQTTGFPKKQEQGYKKK